MVGRVQREGIDPREFRETLGRFATGITVVTTVYEGETFGMTANAFTSVSMDPPLVLVAVDHKTLWHEKASRSTHYGVSVLCAEQGEISTHFAGKPQEGLEIPFVWRGGMPLLEGALAHLVCEKVDIHPAGDHTLYIGRVEYLAYQEEKSPLLFYTGSYETLGINIWESSFWW